MGDRDNYKSRKRYDDDRRKKRYDDDDDNDYRERRERRRKPEKSAVERILTPGKTANNVVKTAATGIIAGGTILLMGIYGLFGDSLAGAAYLPMATAVSSAVATACVWVFGRPKTEEAYNEEFTILRNKLNALSSNLDELEAHNIDLENRLANVELLESFEDRLAKHTLDKESQSLNTSQKRKIPTPPKLSSKIPINTVDKYQKNSSSQKDEEIKQ